MRVSASFHQQASSSQTKLNRFLVCGLGSLGQQCVVALKEFGVSVIAIEEILPRHWEIPNLPNLLEELIVGDCRQESVLEQAKIHYCRAVLLVTSSDRVNIETAFAARLLNPQTRLVVRSGKENLNELLSDRLGNYVSFEPTQLPITAFALAALETETLGFFNLEGQELRVVKRQIKVGDKFYGCLTHQLNSSIRRVISHKPYLSRLPESVHQWEPDTAIQGGDTLIYVEVAPQSVDDTEKSTLTTKKKRKRFWRRIAQRIVWKNLQPRLRKFWQLSYQYQTRRVAFICGITVLFLLLCGTGLFGWYYPDITVRDAFYATAVLLLGGYGDLFGELPQTAPMPGWLQLFSLGLTLAGTAFVGVLYALLTETLLTARFQFYRRRPSVPQHNHIVVVGLGRVGLGVAAQLQEFKQPIVGITNTQLDPRILPELPVIADDLANALKKANLPTARSVVVATDDEMVNLEVGLMAHTLNPLGTLIIRTFEEGLSKKLAQLLPDAQVLCAYALAAEAFAGAAFGENIDSLFRLNNQTILVTEYAIDAEDTLHDLLLAEVAYGYGVVPIVYQKANGISEFMPPDDTRLEVGDRMVVLATSQGLRRIEQGMDTMMPKCWQVEVKQVLTPDAIFEGSNAIAHISGCDLSTARALMHNLPGTLPVPLYKHQAQRLVRDLSQAEAIARLVPIVCTSCQDIIRLGKVEDSSC
ncbi:MULTISPECIES: potassium channel family protein [unclassified Coleofasciculus]|uniref:potassium channel family protein n=1 Tax=unclassified Coleofasciculus TaxID=2692782 RepID=UPI00187E6D5F|nr:MULTISPECIES: potassium channel protein [unclassified Coleofasciculus]MBE9127961.1 NAD-binding protein [Coleofasciculus sp. LEGE 07081]MBE9149860.1 NAD-binding protein [Coleofasciculus sp. LEGE 07092]